ncbi:Uncharacterised protein [Shigella sonnei]|nr:Uncharacterised protein [Shigella sonnei]CSX99602.1 Uncharacterised protein [Shigella sonnei]CSZ06669.1 Uncharacterised protein [Shigella sonnei]
MEAHLFSAFRGDGLPERTVLTRLTVHPETTVTSVISRHTVHRVLKRMPCGFVATGTEATDITVFNQGFGLLTGGIVGMQDATVPGRLTVQVAVNGTEHPVAAKNGNRAADCHENVSFC